MIVEYFNPFLISLQQKWTIKRCSKFLDATTCIKRALKIGWNTSVFRYYFNPSHLPQKHAKLRYFNHINEVCKIALILSHF